MSRFRIDALALAAQLCVIAGCAQQRPYEAPAATPNPWAGEPATQVAQAAAAPAGAAQIAYAPQAESGPNPNVGGTRHGQRVAPEAPPAPPTPVAAPSPPAQAAPAPAAPAAPPAPPAKKAAKAAAPKAAPKKAAAPAKSAEPLPIAGDAHTRTQAPLRGKPALESPGKQILGVGAPVRLATQLENDAGMWWYVETESGANGWLRDSEVAK